MNESRANLLPGEGERLTVCQFMERALYDPAAGYYTRNIRSVGGSSADFATSASLDPGFSDALANWIEHEISTAGDLLCGAGGNWHLIELGGGAGHLASGIQRALGWSGRRRTQYHIVEVSPVLREAQSSTLGRKARKITWHRSIEQALSAAGGRAIIFSNEFVAGSPPPRPPSAPSRPRWCNGTPGPMPGKKCIWKVAGEGGWQRCCCLCPPSAQMLPWCSIVRDGIPCLWWTASAVKCPFPGAPG